MNDKYAIQLDNLVRELRANGIGMQTTLAYIKNQWENQFNEQMAATIRRSINHGTSK